MRIELDFKQEIVTVKDDCTLKQLRKYLEGLEEGGIITPDWQVKMDKEQAGNYGFPIVNTPYIQPISYGEGTGEFTTFTTNNTTDTVTINMEQACYTISEIMN